MQEQEEMPVVTYRTERAIVHIHRPVLTEEERAKRMKAIEQAAIRLYLANERYYAEQERKRLEAEQAAG